PQRPLGEEAAGGDGLEGHAGSDDVGEAGVADLERHGIRRRRGEGGDAADAPPPRARPGTPGLGPPLWRRRRAGGGAPRGPAGAGIAGVSAFASAIAAASSPDRD